jgi:hypothetical protein
MQVRLLFTGGERWGRYYQVRDPDSPILDLLNVRYVISNGPLVSPGHLKKRAELPGHMVWENPDPQARFFLVGRVRRAAGMDDALRLLRSPGFDPRTEAVVEGDIADPSCGGSVRTLRYSAREVVLETDAAAPSFLATSEAWYPGWVARIDGREQPLALTNVAFRGLPVPAGRHTVVMRFDPPVLWRGALLSLAGVLLTLLLWVRDNKRNGPSWTSSSS